MVGGEERKGGRRGLFEFAPQGWKLGGGGVWGKLRGEENWKGRWERPLVNVMLSSCQSK